VWRCLPRCIDSVGYGQWKGGRTKWFTLNIKSLRAPRCRALAQYGQRTFHGLPDPIEPLDYQYEKRGSRVGKSCHFQKNAFNGV